MSLINEALKKAQQDVRGGDVPSARRPSATSYAGQEGGGSSRKLIILGFGVILVAAASAYVLLGGSDSQAVAEATVVRPSPREGAPPADVVANPAAPVAPVVEAEPEAPTQEPIIITLPPKPVPSPVESVVPPAAPPVAVIAVEPAPVADPAPAEVARAAKSEQIASMVELMRVTLGVPRTGRCVVDGLVFKVGDIISTEPKIQLKSVGDDSVAFVDVNGFVYEKKYR